MVPTIHDVAARAGVSTATVSRVINKSATVTEGKQRRVEEAVRELDYRPNPNALGLKGRRTGGVGVLLPYIVGDFFSRFLLHIDETTRDNGQFLLASSSHRSVDEFRTVLHSLDSSVDGLIVMSTDVAAREVVRWLPSGVPIVFVNTDVEGAEVTSVSFDNHGGAVQIAEHLLEQGHRRIAHVSAPPRSYDGLTRREGFVGVLASHGLELSLDLPSDYSFRAGQAAAAAVLAADPRPTAVFAANDLSALGLLAGLQDAGVDVPDEIAVAGFDDSPLTRLSAPQLTTVHVPLEEVGQLAIERLMAQMNGGPAHLGDTVLPTSLVVRGSTAYSLA